MPATSIVQAFAQLAIIFFKLSMEPLRDDEMTLISSVKFRFLGPVFPGDTIHLTMKPKRLEGSVGMFTADARVDNKSVVKGALTLAKTGVARFEDAPW